MLYAPILLDFAFYAKALPNCFKADILTCSILCAFPSIDSDILHRTVSEFTVARQSVIFTRFPFHSAEMRNTLAIQSKNSFAGVKVRLLIDISKPVRKSLPC